MIDRKARDEFSYLIDELFSGRMTNWQYEKRLPKSKDNAVYEIHAFGVWGAYDDLKEHYMAPQLADEMSKYVTIWRLFLRTDNEYRWPKRTGVRELPLSIINVTTLGILNRLRWRAFRRPCIREFWPFLSAEELQDAEQSACLTF